MTRNMMCRDFQFEIGESYHTDDEIQLRRNGFHFCSSLREVFKYYDPDSRNGNRFFEIAAINPISDGDIYVTADITIIRELTNEEIYRVYYGDGEGHGYISGDGYGYSSGNQLYDYEGYGFGYGLYGDYTGCGYGYGGDGSGWNRFDFRRDHGHGTGDGPAEGDCKNNTQKIMIFMQEEMNDENK